MDTRFSRAAWVVTMLSLLLGPLVAAVGIGMGLASKRGGGDWQPTVALGCLVVCAWLALAAVGIGMG